MVPEPSQRSDSEGDRPDDRPGLSDLADRPIKIIGPGIDPGHATGGVRELWRHRRLLWSLMINDLKRRYAGSSIGFFWSVITPLLELATYTFVFHFILNIHFRVEEGWTNYALFLFCGMVVWLTVADGLMRATSSIIDHGHLIKKVHFPAITLPGHVIASSVLDQSIRLGVLAAAALALGDGISWHFLLVAPLMVIQTAFVLGAGLLLCTMAVYFRDTIHWLKAWLTLWMFITPLFYPASTYPDQFALLLNLNPLAHLVGVYRELALNQTIPHPHQILVVAVMALFSLLVGYSVFHHHRDRFADLV